MDTNVIKLGTAVEYRDSKGRSKAGWVIGTPTYPRKKQLAGATS